MSIVAWDGKILAADKMACVGDLPRTVTKLFKSGDVLIAVTGGLGHGLELIEWYNAGADPKTYPESQLTDDWCRLIVYDHGIKIYEEKPWPSINTDPYDAWGSGRAYAIGALACGKSAIEAVEIASSHCVYCGNGVDWYET